MRPGAVDTKHLSAFELLPGRPSAPQEIDDPSEVFVELISIPH